MSTDQHAPPARGLRPRTPSTSGSLAVARPHGDAVAVVGLGCVYPGAVDVDAFWHNIVSGVDATSEAPADRIDPRPFGCQRGGFVPDAALQFDPGRFGIMPLAVDGAEPDQLLALATAAAAIDDAGGLDDVARERVGVILGRGAYLTPGLARLDQRVRTADQLLTTLRDLLPDVDDERLVAVQGAFTAQLGEPRPEAAIGLVPNLAASRIANRLDLGGPAYTLDAACASSLVAVDAAVAELRSGRCDAVLAGGVHHCHDVTLWSVFSQLGALSPTGRIRPFSRDADGILVAEGTGVLVLERLADAERLGHRVYAVVGATGVSSDGRDASLMSPRVDGQVLALERAYRDAGIDPALVGLVEGHGTATVAGDRAELDTLRRVFGKHEEPAERPVLGSVKSMIGHAMPAAGAAGLIKAVLAVHHGVLPPTLAAEDPNPELAETRFQLLAEARPWEPGRGRARIAGVDAFGFGGINAHAVITQHGTGAPSADPRLLRTPPRFRFDALLLAGRDAADLAGLLAEVRARPDQHPTGVPVGSGPARLAVVDPTDKKLELAARVLDKGTPWRGRNDVFFEPEGLLAGGGRVAFLFPGVEPDFRADIADVAAWFGLELPAVPDGATELELQGRQIFTLGRLLHEALGTLGIRPDEVAGHSLGEWTGVFAAELIPPGDADAFLDGLEPGSLQVPGVVFVALGCGADVAAEVVADLPDVVVSHDNCPHQSIVCGPEEAVGEVLERMAARKVFAQALPFRSGFHSPAFAPYLDIVHHHWGRMPLQPARTRMWSATTCAPYPDDADAVRALAARHLVEPVRFRELLGRLHDEGTRVFVQLGVGSLVAFADDTLKGSEQLAVAAHSAKRSGLDQLARVAAALWVEGAPVELGALRASPAGSPPAGAARAAGPTVRLQLGVPTVRLPADAVAAIGLRTSAATVPSATDPLGREHESLLAEALDAGRAVLDALGDHHVPAPPPPPPTTSREVRRVGLDTHPWLVDHCFYRQADGWADLTDRFPVVPMTTMVEWMADAAARLHPGLVVTRVDGIRALRWLPAAPAVDVTITATTVEGEPGTPRVDVVIEGYARATVQLAAEHPPAPPPAATPLRAPRPSPKEPGPLYAEHWMFHGPAFQGVLGIDALGDDGVDGAVESLPTPGAFLDNAGQLYGWWVMATAAQDFLALPQSIASIERFGPAPPLGTAVPTTVRITELTDRTVRADLELLHEGRVNVRITGWVDRRFDSDPPLWLMLREPEHHLLATAHPDGATTVEERWRDSASRELMARRFLTTAERAHYDGLNPRDQRFWLLGRIAAKDAVRHARWAEGAGPLFPAELTLADVSGSVLDGVVTASGAGADGWQVAVTAGEWHATARILRAEGTTP